MHGRSAIWFLLLVLTLLAALTLWIEQLVQPPTPAPDSRSRHAPDYILSNFSTIKTDINGNLRNSLEAAEMRHYPDDDSTELTRPRFTMHTANKPFTRIEGDRGQVTSDGKNIYVIGNVKVVRGATPQKGELTLLTDYLHIIPDDDIAKTDRPVTITQAPKTVIRGTGLLYNKKQGTLELYKNVRIHYERPVPQRTSSKAPATKTKPSTTKQNGKSPRAGARPATAKTANQTSIRRKND
jgi:lipopolysaccharide export system protein LptC